MADTEVYDELARERPGDARHAPLDHVVSAEASDHVR
jgi:hypothetical protein